MDKHRANGSSKSSKGKAVPFTGKTIESKKLAPDGKPGGTPGSVRALMAETKNLPRTGPKARGR